MRFIWHSLKNESWSSKVALVTHCFFKLLFCNIRRGICVPFLLVKPVLHNQTHTWSETWISNFPEVSLLDLVYCSKVSCTEVSTFLVFSKHNFDSSDINLFVCSAIAILSKQTVCFPAICVTLCPNHTVRVYIGVITCTIRCWTLQ